MAADFACLNKIRNPNTRLPTPETAFSLCAGISGNGGQVEIRNNSQIFKIQMPKNSYLEFQSALF
jgi:hypothetical protein